jgi:hypothetical protein
LVRKEKLCSLPALMRWHDHHWRLRFNREPDEKGRLQLLRDYPWKVLHL